MKREKINILRLVLCSAAMCLVLVCMLWLYVRGTDKFTEMLAEISPEKDSMKNTLWLFEKVMYILPVCVIFSLQLCFYRSQRKRATDLCIHREGAAEGAVMYIFTFAVLLPAVYMYSKNHPEPDAVNAAGDAIKETLYFMSRTVQWFMWQAILLLTPLIYHSASCTKARAELERENICEDEDIEK